MRRASVIFGVLEDASSMTTSGSLNFSHIGLLIRLKLFSLLRTIDISILLLLASVEPWHPS